MDYTRLFLGPIAPLARPNGSFWLGGETKLMQDSTMAVQALYQHLVGRNDAASIDDFTRNLAGFHKADAAHYDALLHGCIEEGEALALFDDPKHPYTRELLAAAHIARAPTSRRRSSPPSCRRRAFMQNSKGSSLGSSTRSSWTARAVPAASM